MDEIINTRVLTMEEEGYISVSEYAELVNLTPMSVLRAITNPDYAEYFARRRQGRRGKGLWFIKLADVLKYKETKKTLWRK